MTAPDFVDPIDLEEFREGDSEAIIGQVQDAIRSYCGWHIAPSLTETFTVDGSGSRSLRLPSLCVTDVSQVQNAGAAINDYDWSSDGYIRLRSGRFTDRPRQVVVTYTHGYDQPPAAVVGVATAVADRVRATGGLGRQAAGPFTLELTAAAGGAPGGVAFFHSELAILDHYRLASRP